MPKNQIGQFKTLAELNGAVEAVSGGKDFKDLENQNKREICNTQ